MRRAVATVLVFILVLANVAWSADLDEAVAGSGVKVTDGSTHHADGADDLHEDHQASCDHCCHGSAHFVGLPPARLLVAQARDNDAPVPARAPYRTRTIAPPLHPPQS